MLRRLRIAYLQMILVAGLALLMTGCSGSAMAPPPPPLLSVSLSKSTATVDVGTTLQLSATVSNDSTHGGVSWALSGPGTLSNQTSTSVTYTGPGSSGSATVTATAVADNSKSANATITVAPLPAITAPAQIPPVNIGQSYSLQLSVTAGTGTPPFTWSVTQGQLPKGLSLDGSTGLISGTAQAAVVQQAELASNPASSTTVVPVTIQVADSSTPSQSSAIMLNFDVVGGNASALGFVYVAGDFVISEYSIGSDGTLTLMRPQSLPGSALARSPGVGAPLVVDSLHRFVYGLGANEIFQYKVAADGTLAEMTPLSVTLSAGSGTIVNTTGIVMNGGAAVYMSSNVGVFAFSVGQDGQLHQLGPPVRPTIGPDATCIAVNPSGNIVYTCAGQGIDSYTVKQDGTLQLLATSLPLHDTNGVVAFPFHLGFNNDNAVVVAETTHLATYAIQGGMVNPNAIATGPEDAASMLDLSVQGGTAFAVAGDLIVPAPPGGGTNDHLSLYDLQAGLGTPGKRDTGRGPGLVLALAFTLQTGPPTPNPLVYVTNSRDNNVAQCIPSVAPRCTTVAIVSADMDPHGITGFLGSPGN